MNAEDKVALEVGRETLAVLRAYKVQSLSDLLAVRMKWMREERLPVWTMELVVADMKRIEAASGLYPTTEEV